MSADSVSAASASNAKAAQIAAKANVGVLKKSLDIQKVQGEMLVDLIEKAGIQINTTA